MVGAPAGNVELALMLPVTGPLDVGKSDGSADAELELLEGSPAGYVGDPSEGADDGPASGVP